MKRFKIISMLYSNSAQKIVIKCPEPKAPPRPEISNTSIEFARRTYNESLNWYKSAESKAQILLGVVGAFIVFLSGIIFRNPKDLKDIIGRFDTGIWIGLGLFFLSICFSLFACYRCLWSRLNEKRLKELANTGDTYADDRLLFFGFHALHEPDKLFRSLKAIDTKRELNIYAIQMIELSKNVLKKHQWVNWGFVSVCVSVLLLLVTTVLYLGVVGQ
jgi:hypothetical protein